MRPRTNQKSKSPMAQNSSAKIHLNHGFSIYGRKYWIRLKGNETGEKHRNRTNGAYLQSTYCSRSISWLMITANNRLFLSFPQMFIVYNLPFAHRINCHLFGSITSGYEINLLFHTTTWLLLLLLFTVLYSIWSFWAPWFYE